MPKSEFKNIYLISYKKNGGWNPVKHESEKRFKDNGFTVTTFEGYSLKEQPDIKPNQVCYRNIQKFFYENPSLLKKNVSGFFISEDDSYVADFVNPKFLQDRLESVNDYQSKIIRVGYQKILKYKVSKEYPRGYYVVGTQLLWFPKKSIKTIMGEFETKRAQHLNGFLSKNINLDVELLDSEEQIRNKNKYVFEIEHLSTTTGKIRRGKKIT